MSRRNAVHFTAGSVSLCAQFFFFFHSAVAAPPQPVWAQIFASPQSDGSPTIAADAQGAIYLSGDTLGTIGAASQGSRDAFVAKLDPTSQRLWTRQFGAPMPSSSFETNEGIATTSDGVYAVGSTFGNLAGVSAGSIDGFVRKYDLAGNHLWTRQFGTAEIDSPRGIAADGQGNIYISGQTDGALAGAVRGSRDAFVAKYDGAGNLLWSKQLGSTGFDNSLDIAVDALGNSYVTGFTLGDFAGPNAGDQDGFLVKLDAGGNMQWDLQFGTAAMEQPTGVAVDLDGNPYVTGVTEGQLGPTHFGSGDAFLVKFDSAGTQLWTQQWGSNLNEASTDVAVDDFGNAYIVGSGINNPFGGPYTSAEAFAVKFSPQGSELWAFKSNGATVDRAWSVLVTGKDIYIGGTYSGTPSSQSDIYLLKLRDIPEPSTGCLAIGMLALTVCHLLRVRQPA